ncbi:hypothetical protein [Couchioplanes azureus]|uniref:hypothetical protein n=1 Tax=Couchioplanes caeruleus TaxID=56438 RepID=UPI0016712261|nr:hypothetical protein [Couchioplanes caeruleus]GGQ44806.1 hypothetical protein GCM10010166_11710 [Couchioplanes caeruleus subsp. azureus]
MRRKPSLFLTLLTAAAAIVAAPGTPAQAAPAAVKMTFNAAPEPVVKGKPVTLSGRVWVGATGNRSRISFYFRKAGTAANAYVYKGFATATDAGNFTRRFTAETTGTWKAVFAGTAARRNAARLDAVQVVQTRSREIANWHGTATPWKSRTINVPTVDYKAVASWNCPDTNFPFLYLTWEGKTSGYEYVGSEKQSGSVTLNGHEGGRLGFFEISTASGCSWNLRVFSGVTTVPV